MKNAIVLHGTGNTPNDYWYPSVASYLGRAGYDVWAPQLPNADRPVLESSLAMLMEQANFAESTVLIGHSSAGPLIVSILERIETQIAQAIAVAGFYQPLNDDGASEFMLQEKYDWQRVKLKVIPAKLCSLIPTTIRGVATMSRPGRSRSSSAQTWSLRLVKGTWVPTHLTSPTNNSRFWNACLPFSSLPV